LRCLEKTTVRIFDLWLFEENWKIKFMTFRIESFST
jgi:hypothetical protein